MCWPDAVSCNPDPCMAGSSKPFADNGQKRGGVELAFDKAVRTPSYVVLRYRWKGCRIPEPFTVAASHFSGAQLLDAHLIEVFL